MPEKFAFNQSDVKRIAEAVRKSESVSSFGGGFSIDGRQQPTIFAKITAQDTSTPIKYSWQQQYSKDDGTWADGDISGSPTDGNPAVEVNGGSASIGDRVILERRPIVDSSGSVSLGWVFSAGGSLPIGQYPGMAWMVIANNQSAYAYPFAVQTV